MSRCLIHDNMVDRDGVKGSLESLVQTYGIVQHKTSGELAIIASAFIAEIIMSSAQSCFELDQSKSYLEWIGYLAPDIIECIEETAHCFCSHSIKSTLRQSKDN